MTMCAYMSPEERGKTAVNNIIENYLNNEKALIQQLKFQVEIHEPTAGSFRETVWRSMFEQILPKKFAIEQSVFIIDSKRRVSREVDLAIFDETYTPYIFHFEKLKFLPIEAVAVVVECKSSTLGGLKVWTDSIEALETSDQACVRMVSEIVCGFKPNNSQQDKPRTNPKTQTRTRPLRILCRMGEGESKKIGMFDMVISASGKKNKLLLQLDPAKKDLRDWYLALNHAGYTEEEIKKIKEGLNPAVYSGDCVKDIELSAFEVKSKGKIVSLLTLNLQLNQLLMLINNPILFPHKAYADMFNGHYEKKVESK